MSALKIAEGETDQAILHATPEPMEAIRWRRTAYRLSSDHLFDETTGLFARDYFEELLVTHFKQARRQAKVLGLLFINLGLGEMTRSPAAENVVRQVVNHVRQSLRKRDIVARYGPDQLCIITVDNTPDHLQSIGERLLQGIDDRITKLECNGGVEPSIGAVVCLPSRQDCSYDRFLTAVDRVIHRSHRTPHRRFQLISLLNEEDQINLAGVRERLFSRYLEKSGIISPELVRDAACRLSSPPVLMGRLARRLGWINTRRLRGILAEQRETHGVFGAIAVERRYLKRSQLFALLSIQQENPEELTEILIAESHLSPLQGRQLLHDYYERMYRGEGAAKGAVVSP
jgi:diguanylate cyclase (GGDEF)-like protein